MQSAVPLRMVHELEISPEVTGNALPVTTHYCSALWNQMQPDEHQEAQGGREGFYKYTKCVLAKPGLSGCVAVLPSRCQGTEDPVYTTTPPQVPPVYTSYLWLGNDDIDVNLF